MSADQIVGIIITSIITAYLWQARSISARRDKRIDDHTSDVKALQADKATKAELLLMQSQVMYKDVCDVNQKNNATQLQILKELYTEHRDDNKVEHKEIVASLKEFQSSMRESLEAFQKCLVNIANNKQC